MTPEYAVFMVVIPISYEDDLPDEGIWCVPGASIREIIENARTYLDELAHDDGISDPWLLSKEEVDRIVDEFPDEKYDQEPNVDNAWDGPYNTVTQGGNL